jgi:hypothetical protein
MAVRMDILLSHLVRLQGICIEWGVTLMPVTAAVGPAFGLERSALLVHGHAKVP